MRAAFIESLCEAAERDERVWLLTADLGYSVLEAFRDRFPKRYVNVGVAEQNMAGIAAGLARSGKAPFIYSIANFPTFRCLEQIRVDVCYHEANVKIVAVGGGFSYGAQGYTHHGIEDLAVMRALPGMTVVAPGDPLETKQAVAALVDRPGPGYLRLGKGKEPIVHATRPKLQIGEAIAVREGSDVTLISTGAILPHALDTAARLEADGLSVRVLSMHTVKPLDADAVLRAACETRGIVTVEEHSVTGGLGSAVADVLAESGIRCGYFRKWGVPDAISHTIGSQEFLRRRCGDLYELARRPFSYRRAA